ncbi:MAG: sulfite exporter TauE/SafE family protein [Phycisphaerae bacterium]|nr:sulfite exporter TauE/SafE family protein [Phycisphaerae bacterium]
MHVIGLSMASLLELPQAELANGGPLVVLLVALGLGIGTLTGLFGVGGAFLLNPILIIVFGMSEATVIGSSLSFTIGTGAGGTARHMRRGNVEFRSMFIIGVGAIVGAVLGADLLVWLQKSLGATAYESTIRASYLALLLLTAWVTFRDPSATASRHSVLQRTPIPPHVKLPAAKLAGVSVPGLVGVGVLIGLTKGLLGIGGGVLFMPLLLLVVGLSAHQAVGTSLGVVLFSSAAGTIQHGLHDNVNLVMVMALVVGSSVGVQAGAWMCERLAARRLRRYFAAIAFLAAVMVAADLIRKLT